MKKVYGIVGHPVEHSYSPVMHNAAFKAEGIDAEYKVFDINPSDEDNLANFCYETEFNNIAGFSVTMPYKEEISKYMDNFDPLSKIIGSVNTVENSNSQLNGYNTDVTGCIQALKEKSNIKGEKVLVLGAGGASRAICYGLNEYGADVYVFNRTKEKADELAKEFNIETIEFRHIPEAEFDIVVNTTSVGMTPNSNESLLHAEQLKGVKVVMDIITNPIKTQLLIEAEKAGCETITGARMLLHQACGQFEIWFGKSAPIEVMEDALYSKLQN